MNFDLKNFSGSFKAFMNASGKYLLFTTLFYSLWLVRTLLFEQDFDLQRFQGRMIGIATFDGYDVGARVSLFYKCAVVLLTSFFGLNLLGYFIYRKKSELLNGTEIKIVNYASLAGILFILFQLCDLKSDATLELVYFMHKLMLGAILLKLFFFSKNKLSIYNYVLILTISISVYFLVLDFYRVFGASKNPDFLIGTFLLCCLLLIGTNLLLKKKSVNGQFKLNALSYVFVPLSFLPFISILKDEIFLVLKTNNILLSGTLPIYFVLLLIVAVFIFLRLKRSKNHPLVSQKEIISKGYFPALIFSLISFILYSPYINYSTEVFEAGNKYLAIMEFKLFGVIPTLEKFNSHLVSDYFFSAIYTMFNGLQGREMELYDFFYTPISYALFYYLVYYITRNPFISIFTILLYPLTTSLLPESYSLGILCVFAFHKLTTVPQTIKNYLVFFAVLVGVVFWRIDLGYSCVVAMILMILYYHFFSNRFKIEWPLLFKAAGIIVISIISILTALSVYRHANLFTKLIYALNYLTSAQTYGFSVVGPQERLIYKIHYFIFPTLVALVLIALLLKNKELNKSRAQRLAFLSLLFSCAFYLVNFNRGLIRHSLVEGMDHFTTSLAYLIFAGSVFVFFPRGSQVYKFIVFSGIAFFTLITFKLPDPKKSMSYFEILLDKIHANEKINLAEINDRVLNRPSKERSQDKGFIDFIAKNTAKDETFIDFCNSPMLFFYTKKITPSYFWQNPVCSHNDFLQNVFIDDLKNYKTPYLLFMRHDDMSRDMLDDVPNTLRHYRIAEYLFQHYKPYIYINYLGVWRRNDIEDKISSKEVSFFKVNTPDSVIKFNIVSKPGKNYMAKLIVKQKANMDLNSSNTNVHLHGPDYVNDSLAYCYVEVGMHGGAVNLHNANIKSLQLFESDYRPDISCEKHFSYNFQKVPHIWGTYDKNLDKEPILFEKKLNIALKDGFPYSVQIPEVVDRTSGNTLLITCKNKGKKEQELIIWFGNKKEAEKSKIVFRIYPGNKDERYAIRVSSVYKWYVDKINVVDILSESDDVTISKIQLTKGM